PENGRCALSALLNPCSQPAVVLREDLCRAMRATQGGGDSLAELVHGNAWLCAHRGSEFLEDVVLEVEVDGTHLLRWRKKHVRDGCVPAVVHVPCVMHLDLPASVAFDRT